MRKKSIILAAALCVSIAAGCAETPKEPIVKRKGAQTTKQYQEVKDKNTEEKNVESNILEKQLNVPKRYETALQSEDGSFQLECNAAVHLPEVSQAGIYKVGQLPFDDAFIDRVTKAFFGDSPVYNGDKYFQTTKAEALEMLEKLKKYEAEGNTDPYGLIAQWEEAGEEVNPEEIYSLQRDIASWEETYANAPEQIEKEAVLPRIETDSAGGYFRGAVEQGDKKYDYTLKTGAGDHMYIEVSRLNDGNAKGQWFDGAYDVYRDTETEEQLPEKETVEKDAGITPEEAQKIADEYMEKLGLKEEFSAKRVSPSIKWESTGNRDREVYGGTAGYQIDYTRDLDGFPVTWETNWGGGLESMESTLESWAYERVEIVVNKDGLQHAVLANLYQVEEKQVE